MRRPLALCSLSLAFIALSICLWWIGPRALDWLPDGFERPVLALELAQSPADFVSMTREPTIEAPHRRAADRYALNTYVDFAFIACAAALWVLMLADHPRARLMWIGIGLVVLAAIADVSEDAGLLIGLHAPAVSMATVDAVRHVSLAKWTLLGAAFLLLATRFRQSGVFRDGWQLWQLAIGAAYAYAGVLCLVGLLSHPVIERVQLPLGTAILMQTIFFWHRHAERSRGPIASITA